MLCLRPSVIACSIKSVTVPFATGKPPDQKGTIHDSYILVLRAALHPFTT